VFLSFTLSRADLAAHAASLRSAPVARPSAQKPLVLLMFGAGTNAWAIRAGLKNRFGWVFEGQPSPPVFEAVEDQPALNVTFVLPDRLSPL
jgi:hypothetical protein